jgi:predicted DNA-binding transcriptional regulator AlpA
MMSEVPVAQPVAGFVGFGPKLLDVKAVAEMLGVSQSWVRDHSGPNAAEPRLPAMKLGGGKTSLVRYHFEDIQAFIEEQRRVARLKAVPVRTQ